MSLLHDVLRELQHHPHQVRCPIGPLPDRSAVRSVRCRIGPLPDRSAAGRLPDVMDPGIHGARTHWIRGFMAFQLARRIRDRDADGVGVT
jgi:hypothetical protein